MNEALYPMRIVVERTGLTSHLIRAWERRYGAVVPHRTETNRRLYSDADIRRLRLLRRAVEGGHAISRVAGLTGSELESLSLGAPSSPVPVSDSVSESRDADDYVQLALEACIELDAGRLREVLSQAEMDLGRYPLLERVIGKLLGEIGILWSKGEMRPSQEHMTSSVIRQFLGDALARQRLPEGAPAILMATPSGHSHELGCLIAANAAQMRGWRTLYLGPDLPAEEIAKAARLSGVRAVGLSLIYPARNAQTATELERLRRLLPEDTTLIISGRIGFAYSDLDLPHTEFVSNLEELLAALEDLL